MHIVLFGVFDFSSRHSLFQLFLQSSQRFDFLILQFIRFLTKNDCRGIKLSDFSFFVSRSLYRLCISHELDLQTLSRRRRKAFALFEIHTSCIALSFTLLCRNERTFGNEKSFTHRHGIPLQRSFS